MQLIYAGIIIVADPQFHRYIKYTPYVRLIHSEMQFMLHMQDVLCLENQSVKK